MQTVWAAEELAGTGPGLVRTAVEEAGTAGYFYAPAGRDKDALGYSPCSWQGRGRGRKLRWPWFPLELKVSRASSFVPREQGLR